MDFCKFYGMTGAQVVLMTMNPQTFEKAIKLLNNPADYKFVMDFKYELDLLKEFLTNRVKYNYSDAKVRKLATSYDRSVKYKKSYGITNYNGDIESIKHLLPADKVRAIAKHLLTDQEEQDAKQVLDNSTKVISETIVGFDNKKYRMTPEQIAIVTFFKEREKYIDTYRNRIQESSFTDQQVFGRKLYRVMMGTGADIKNTVAKVLKKSERDKAYRDKVIKSYKQDIVTLKSKILSKEEYLKRKQEQENVMRKAITDQELVRLIQLCDKRMDKFEVCEMIETMYGFSKLFTVYYYNSVFNINLTEEEMKQQLTELSRIGLVGLNLCTTSLLRNFLTSVTFAEEIETFVEEGSELAKSVRDIDLLLETLLPFGASLEVK